ncbi:alpha/beta hydrolases superfamily protein, partial [Tanacetum coccineum]
MTRSSKNELLTPIKDPKQEFRSSRKLFKTLSLDESRSPKYNLFFDLEENFEEEVAEITEETMEQYMRKTRADYRSGIARPKIDDKDHFELKDQIMLRVKTKFLSKYCPPARTVKKIEEINNFQQEPDETLYQAWERFKELLMKFPQHYLTEMHEVILFYNGLDVPTRQILDSKGVIPTKTIVNAKVAIQEMAEYSQKWHNGIVRTISTKTSDGLAAIQAQLNNLGREIKKVLQERGFRSLPSSNETNQRDHVKSISTTVEADMTRICRIRSSQYAVSAQQNKARLMGETLVLNRSLDPLYEDYIDLNDLNVPLELRRDKVDDLMPTIEE